MRHSEHLGLCPHLYRADISQICQMFLVKVSLWSCEILSVFCTVMQNLKPEFISRWDHGSASQSWHSVFQVHSITNHLLRVQMSETTTWICKNLIESWELKFMYLWLNINELYLILRILRVTFKKKLNSYADYTVKSFIMLLKEVSYEFIWSKTQ